MNPHTSSDFPGAGPISTFRILCGLERLCAFLSYSEERRSLSAPLWTPIHPKETSEVNSQDSQNKVLVQVLNGSLLLKPSLHDPGRHRIVWYGTVCCSLGMARCCMQTGAIWIRNHLDTIVGGGAGREGLGRQRPIGGPEAQVGLATRHDDAGVARQGGHGRRQPPVEGGGQPADALGGSQTPIHPQPIWNNVIQACV